MPFSIVNILKNNSILFICLLGSLVRFLYGYFYEPWNNSPDQLAWELLLEQQKFRYDHLIHYPHEGGTILISAVQHIIILFSGYSSLAISAMIFDFVVRFIQIKIIKSVFSLNTALIFGVWSIFATPSIIPWGTLSFGLHYISSVFPFALLFIIHKRENSKKFFLLSGIFLGLAFWFSYINFILIIAFYLFLIISKEKLNLWFYSIFSVTSIIIIHLVFRIFLDAGFHLNEFDFLSIRGENFFLKDIDLLNRIYSLPSTTVNSIVASSQNIFLDNIFKVIYYLLFIVAIGGIYISYKKQLSPKKLGIIISVLVCFLALYIISPFFYDKDFNHYINYRHLTYIIPLLSLLTILGLKSIKYNKALILIYLLMSFVLTVKLFTNEKISPGNTVTQATGWVVGTKLGHDSNAIVDIINKNSTQKKLLIQGIGWGISTSLMQDVDTSDTTYTETKINTLVELIYKYPKSYKNDILLGIDFSFSNNVKPKLDKDLLNKFKIKIAKKEMLSN